MSAPHIVAQFNVGTHTKDTHLFWGRVDSGATLLDGLQVPPNSDINQRVDVKSYGDLVAESNDIEVTTLSHPIVININGLPADAAIDYELNFTDWNMRQVIEDALHPLHYLHRMSNGWHLRWNGEHNITVPGGGVDEAVDFTLNITVLSSMNWYDAAGVFMPIARPAAVAAPPAIRSWDTAFAAQQP